MGTKTTKERLIKLEAENKEFRSEINNLKRTVLAMLQNPIGGNPIAEFNIKG